MQYFKELTNRNDTIHDGEDKIRDDENDAIRDKKNGTIRDKKNDMICNNNTEMGARRYCMNNRATVIYSTNLEISPAAPRSVFGREAARPKGRKAKAMTTQNKIQ